MLGIGGEGIMVAGSIFATPWALEVIILEETPPIFLNVIRLRVRSVRLLKVPVGIVQREERPPVNDAV